MGVPQYDVSSDVVWYLNGRKGRGLNRDAITDNMMRAAVTEPLLELAQKHFQPNRRAVHALAAALYVWYKAHSYPFPGVQIRELDVSLVRRGDGIVVARIDVSSGGVVEFCRFK